MASLRLDGASLTEEEKRLQREYKTEFSSNGYLERYTGVDKSFNAFHFQSLYDVFNSDLVKGNSLLEVGCGPTIHSVISASRHVKHIVLSDFVESNRASVLKWLKNEPGAHDWTPVFKHFAALEKQENYSKLEERVRKSVEDVIHCDVLQSNPIAPVKKQFDIIVTSYCFECATTDSVSYKKAVGNVANLLNPGGTLIIAGELSGTFYCVGDKKFPSPVVTKDLVHDALSAAKLNVVYWCEEPVQKSEHFNSVAIFIAIAKQ